MYWGVYWGGWGLGFVALVGRGTGVGGMGISSNQNLSSFPQSMNIIMNILKFLTKFSKKLYTHDQSRSSHDIHGGHFLRTRQYV